MKTLMQIMNDSSNLMFELVESGGEITPEIEEKIASNAMMLSDKLDTYGFVIEAFKQRQAYALERMKQWERIISLCENALDNLNGRVLEALSSTETREVHGKEFSFKIVLNPVSIVVDDESKVPGQFIISEIKESHRVDKTTIKKAIASGEQVPGVRAVRSERLIIKTSQRKELKGEL